MAKTVQMNLNVLEVTKERVAELSTLTYRNPGDVIDWIVAEAYQRVQEAARAQTTIEQAQQDCKDAA